MALFKLFGGAKRRTMRKRSPMKKRRTVVRRKRSMKKGSKSKTRRGRKNFVTHKGDKDFNARGHRQVKKRSPYSKKRKGGDSNPLSQMMSSLMPSNGN